MHGLQGIAAKFCVSRALPRAFSRFPNSALRWSRRCRISETSGRASAPLRSLSTSLLNSSFARYFQNKTPSRLRSDVRYSEKAPRTGLPPHGGRWDGGGNPEPLRTIVPEFIFTKWNETENIADEYEIEFVGEPVEGQVTSWADSTPATEYQ